MQVLKLKSSFFSVDTPHAQWYAPNVWASAVYSVTQIDVLSYYPLTGSKFYNPPVSNVCGAHSGSLDRYLPSCGDTTLANKHRAHSHQDGGKEAISCQWWSPAGFLVVSDNLSQTGDLEEFCVGVANKWGTEFMLVALPVRLSTMALISIWASTRNSSPVAMLNFTCMCLPHTKVARSLASLGLNPPDPTRKNDKNQEAQEPSTLCLNWRPTCSQDWLEHFWIEYVILGTKCQLLIAVL